MTDTAHEDPELWVSRIVGHLSAHAETFKFLPDLSSLGDDGTLSKIYAVRLIVDDEGRWTITRGPRGRGGLWDAKARDWASAALAETGAYDFPTVEEALRALPDALAAQLIAAQNYTNHRVKMGALP